MFPIIIPFRSGSGGDPIERCSNCGEPINRSGKLLDRHPIIIVFGGVFLVTFMIISLLSWNDSNSDTTFHSFIWNELADIWRGVQRL